jgi:hypothetical protein
MKHTLIQAGVDRKAVPLSNRLAPCIFRVPELECLVQTAPDKELLLTLKLTFECHVRPRELPELAVSNFSFAPLGQPVGVFLPDLRGPAHRRIPIDPQHRPVLAALPPPASRLFRKPNPLARLQRHGAQMGVCLSQRAALYTWVHYARLSGVSAAQVRLVRRRGHRLFADNAAAVNAVTGQTDGIAIGCLFPRSTGSTSYCATESPAEMANRKIMAKPISKKFLRGMADEIFRQTTEALKHETDDEKS